MIIRCNRESVFIILFLPKLIFSSWPRVQALQQSAKLTIEDLAIFLRKPYMFRRSLVRRSSLCTYRLTAIWMDISREDQLEYSIPHLHKELQKMRQNNFNQHISLHKFTFTWTSKFHHKFIKAWHECYLMFRFNSAKKRIFFPCELLSLTKKIQLTV